MIKTLKKHSVIFFLIIIFHAVFVFYVHKILFPVHLTRQNFLFFDLINKQTNLGYVSLFLLDLLNLFLLYLIGKRTLGEPFSLILTAVYAIAPWSVYLVSTESFYIYLLFLILLGIYGIVLIKSKFNFLGSVLFGISLLLSFYSSIFLLVLLPIIILLSILINLDPINKTPTLYITVLILSLPLFFVIVKNGASFKNIVFNDIKLFSDPGIINNVNKYQGSAKEVGMGSLARLSENKYLFFSEYALVKLVKQFTPSTYFTFNAKLLNFSFTPPIYLGLLIPFIYGLYKILQIESARKILLISTILVIPSLLAKQTIDLNKLVLFSPVVFFVISYGLLLLFKGRKEKIKYIFLLVTFVLIIFQTLLTINDIGTRERLRYLRYFGPNSEIKI